MADAGMIHVLPYPVMGDRLGLLSPGRRRRSRAASEAGDHFGAAIGPGRNVWSLWIGAPEEDIGSLVDAGSVVVLSGSSNDTTVKLPGTVGSTRSADAGLHRACPAPPRATTTSAPCSRRSPAPRTSIGRPIVGVPGENVGKIRDAGIVQVTYQDGTWATFQQGVGGVNGTAEAWDRFGASVRCRSTWS